MRRSIFDHQLPPGSRLRVPNIPADLGVSGSPVRDAVQRLTDDAVATTAPRAIRTPRLRGYANTVADLLRSHAPLGVAFSGGVDSTVLLALAIRALGAGQVVAIVGVSPSLADAELADARSLTAFLGVERVEVSTHEGEIAGYVQNGPDRCYFCKDELFTRIAQGVSTRMGLRAVAYGETADDLRRHDRPGSRAAAEHGVLRPLADANLGKAEIRELAFEMGLPNWSKPAAPCLASRIPHFSEVLPEKLRQVQRVESVLRSVGILECRVRHHGEIARIEAPAEQLPRLVASPLREMLETVAREAGFRFVTLDLAGLQSGRLTELAMETLTDGAREQG